VVGKLRDMMRRSWSSSMWAGGGCREDGLEVIK
jgi:hypothetical protein